MNTKFLGATALILLSTVFTGTAPAAAQDDQNKWQGHIEAEGKWGTERSLGEVGVFLPAWQDDDTLLFGDIRGRFDNQDSSEGNFGVGLRQQISPDWIVGGYAFYDRRRTDHDNTFHQATIGAEALSDTLEFRVNGYIPQSDEKRVSAGGISTSATASGGTFQLSTTAGGGVVERALPGVDAEVGYKFDLPDNWEFWAYGGGFHFDTDDYDNISGPRGRLELSYNFEEGSKLTVGVESQTDNVRGDQSWGIARIRLPLNYTDAKRPSELSALDRRMTTRINRDVDIVAGEKNGATTTSTETATASINGNTVNAYTLLQAGDNVLTEVTSAGAGALIVLDGSAGTITTGTGVTLQANQSIMGGGTSVSVTGDQTGKSATAVLPGTRALLEDLGSVGALRVNAPNITIQGFDIKAASGGSGSGLFLRNDGHHISDVNIDASGSYGIRLDGTTNTQISNVSVTDANNAIFLSNTTANGISFTNVTVADSTSGFSINATTTATGLTGAITTANTGTPCLDGGGTTITASTLTVDGNACP